MSEKALLGGLGAAGAAAVVAVAGAIGYVVLMAPEDAVTPEQAALRGVPQVLTTPEPAVPPSDPTDDLAPDASEPMGASEPLDVSEPMDAAEQADPKEADPEPPVAELPTPEAKQTPDAAKALGPAEEPPLFELVRVAADGSAIIAGAAPAGFDVAIEVDGAELASARADSQGAFAALFDLPVSDAAQIVFLVARGAEGQEVRSEDSVILAPRVGLSATVAQTPEAHPDGEEPGIMAAAPEEDAGAADDGESASLTEAAEEGDPGSEKTQAGRATNDVTMEETAQTTAEDPTETDLSTLVAERPAATDGVEVIHDTHLAKAADTVAAGQAAGLQAAPTVLLARKDGVELLRPAETALERLRDRVIVDVISYSDDGSVTLEGRAAAAMPKADRVRVYLNNKPIQTAKVARDGSWRLRLPPVKPGIYTLRVDQVDAAGHVVARFETPFKREDPSALARLTPTDLAPGAVAAAVITVQPGYTLWGIASDRYGDGFDYVQIFEANKAQIRNPDLIYPGQVFELPETVE